jgi:TonB-dependent starch-binding outer membrane protein SusC
MSVFASGQNLALITGYSGIDPEVNVDKNINGIPSRGFDYTQYPRPRIITVGLNVGF